MGLNSTTFQPDLSVATWRDVMDHIYDMAILPWGATEPHNYHLPYLTDCYISKSLALDAANKLFTNHRHKVMVLPPVPFGQQNIGQFKLPFCVHTRYQTQYAILRDWVESLSKQGFNKLLILNGHGGNSFKNMVRDLAFDYPNFLIVVTDWFAITPPPNLFIHAGEHACEVETSLMLHYHPELVRMEVAGSGESLPFKSEELNKKTGWTPRDWSAISKDTGIGNPAEATAEKGKIYSKVITDRIEKLLYELISDNIYYTTLKL
ncbi:MAG: creatininase family protein [Tannerellaceae bacterium]